LFENNMPHLGQVRSSKRRRILEVRAAATGLSLVGSTMPSLTGTSSLRAHAEAKEEEVRSWRCRLMKIS
jgi:hypothetical protein